MSANQNTYATIPDALNTTAAATEFVENVTFNEIPAEALRIGTRCLLDGLGLFVAGSEEHSVQILVEEAEQMGGRKDALLLSRGGTRVPAPVAARVLGTAGAAPDRDRSQGARARHGGSRARLGRQPGQHRSGPRLWAVDAPDHSAVDERISNGAKAWRC